jgi:hypothetical protein
MPYERQVGLAAFRSDTGLPNAFESLASRLNQESVGQFGKATEIYTRIAADKGAAAGMQLDEEGMAVAPELVSAFTQAGEAYNKAALDAYKASASVDMREGMSAIYQEAGDNAELFAEKMDSFQKSFFKNVHPDVKQEMVFEFGKSKMIAGGKVVIADLERKKGEAIGMHNSNINSALNHAEIAAKRGENEDSLRYVDDAFAEVNRKVENGYITPIEGLAEQGEIRKRVLTASLTREIMNAYENGGEQDAMQVVSEINQSGIDGFSLEESESLTKSLMAEVSRLKTIDDGIRTREEIEMERQLSDLLIHADDPMADVGAMTRQMEKMFNDGDATMEQRTRFYNSLDRAQGGARQKMVDYSSISKRLAGDDSAVIDKKTVNGFFDEIYTPSLAEATPQEREASIAAFITRTKIMPQSVVDQIKTNLISNNPELIADAARLIDRVDESPGIMDDGFSAYDRALAQNVSLLSRSMPVEEAVKLAMNNTDPANVDRVEFRKAQLKEEKVLEPKKMKELLNSELNPWFGRNLYAINPVEEDRLAKIVAKNYEELYASGMESKAAKEKAVKLATRNWANDSYSGKPRFTEYAPSIFYPPVNGSHDWVGTQLKEEASLLAGKQLTGDDIYLYSIPETTARTAASGKPEYGVMVRDDNGVLMPTFKRYIPDPTPFFERHKAVLKAEGEARAARTKGMAPDMTMPLMGP